MAKHLPTTIWPAKKMGTYPNVYVRTADDKNITILLADGSPEVSGLKLPRQTAKMLARRINECLEASK